MLPIRGLRVVLSLLLVSGSSAVSMPLNTYKISRSPAAKLKAAGVTNIAAADRARAQALRQTSVIGKRDANAYMDYFSDIGYSIEVGIGNPAKSYELLVDTVSGNTWIGAKQEYTFTNTSTDTQNTVSVSYGTGDFSGKEYLDTISLGSLEVTRQSIGVASKSEGFHHIDGVLGLGLVSLTEGTVSNMDTVPTVMNNLFNQGSINSEILGVYFIPVSQEDASGTLTFGDYDSALTSSDITYAPITSAPPASSYWGIDQSITYGSTDLLSAVSGIVDISTALILIASDAFTTYQSETGAVLDETTGLLKITSDQYNNLKPLIFTIGGTAFTLNPNAQIWPRQFNSVIGDGDVTSIYLIVSDIGSESGSSFDFIIGYTFLERFYSVFDTTNRRVGFATTSNTNSITN
ncbi:acid protease [Rhizopogon vinicolor AM-OR11-026]|uniref:Acid protease n=1 Tax=Rhizopogon vinicolor AM-OR11-026 TaxID=1314800 RepID=A0A1B7NAA5_9AGAM|nr:acid protease [Rhizopogon vinicolor AM-OR11-026]